MDFGHARRYATRLASRYGADFYPGPVLMPHGLLRAFDPVLALALGPARNGGEALHGAVERTLRGRPDGPLLLALWSSIAAGEIAHEDVRTVLRLLPEPLPEQPADREALLRFWEPRVGAVARCLLALARREASAAQQAAERLGCGLLATRLLIDLPAHLAAGRCPIPRADLAACGLSREELQQGLRSPAVDRLLLMESRWARQLLDQGLDLRRHVGARLRRGVRAAGMRGRYLLDRVSDPGCDLFRRPPHLSPVTRWWCAVLALWGLPAAAPPPAPPRAAAAQP